jgi:hypothetical protein
MKTVTLILLLIFVPLTPHSYAQQQRARASESQLVEEFSFAIKDFKMDHQSQMNNLNISVRYRYSANITKADYPDFRWLEKDIETSLTNYPNKADYWEIVNKQLTATLMKKYPSLTRVTIEIEVAPSSLVPFLRSSTVTRYRSDTSQNHLR